MLRPGKSSNGLPSHSGGGYGGGGYYNNDYNAGYNPNSYSNQQQSSSYNSNQSYGGYSPPPQQLSQQPLYSPRRSRDESPIIKIVKNKWLWTILMCFVLLLLTLYYRNQQATLLKQLKVSSIQQAIEQYQVNERERSKWRKDSHIHLHTQEEYKKKMEGLVKENAKLTNEKNDVLKSLSDTKETQKRLSAMQHQLLLLQNATSRESKRAVLEKYGPGPHFVKFILKIPDETKPFTLQTFTVELAPLELVPHAIHLFLEQVSHELWDNTFLYLNGPHVLQSGPQDYASQDDDKNAAALKKFTDHALDKLAFPEYSPDYPHLQYTLGYTGRPGGPDFYINKDNNTIPHGPGGQSQHGIKEQADSCFAKVMDGQDVLERLNDLPTYARNHKFAFFFTTPIEIMSARMVDNNNNAAESNKQQQIPTANKNARVPGAANQNTQPPREAMNKPSPKNARPQVDKKVQQQQQQQRGVEQADVGAQHV